MLRSGSSVRTVRISSRYSVGAGISAGVSIAREASRRTCALAAPHAIPAPDHPTSPADRRPKRYRRHRHSSGRHSPNRSLVPRGRNLRTAPTPYSAPETNTTRKHRRSTVPQPPDTAGTPFGPRNEHRPKTQTQHRPATSGRHRHPFAPPRNEHCPKTQTQHRPVAPERRLSPIRPPKRTPPENTDAAPSRNLRTPPAPIRPPRNEHRPKTQTQHRPATSGRRLPPIRPPKRTPPENTDAAPIRSPPKKTQSSLPEQVPAGMTLIRRDVERHHGTTG